MRIIISIYAILLLLSSCQTIPKNFTYGDKRENTGLEKLINIDGIYVSEHSCDQSFFSVYRFYPDGLFRIATTSQITGQLVDCFESEEKTTICKQILEGRYIMDQDTIKTQVIWPVGNGCVIFRDYRISEEKQIYNISDYVEPEYTKLVYMKNYPSYRYNPCEKEAKFYPLKSTSLINPQAN